MNLTDFKDLVSCLAVISNVLQFLSGTIVCKKYVTNRTTAEASPMPFLLGVVSSGLWLLYGLTKRDDNIIIVNLIGLVLMVAYTVVFYIYTFKKASLLKQIIIMMFFSTLVLGYVYFEEDNEALLRCLGLLACALTMLAIAAPMSMLIYVIKVKSTECLPFPMILMSFIVSSLWFLYGTIEEDAYLCMPNFIGAVLALLQLSFFVLYPSSPKSVSLTKSIIA